MKQITKSKQPKSLTKYKKIADAKYDGDTSFTLVKQDIKNSLLEEQGYLCAYCMRRISYDEMKVEHFLPQSTCKSEQLNYKNLLGCCIGGEVKGESKKNHTCDTKKGNDMILYSPSLPKDKIDSIIFYSSTGLVQSRNEQYDIEINKILNLNYSRYVSNRKLAIEAVEQELSRRDGTRSKEQINKMIRNYTSKNEDGHFKEYYGIILFYLKKKLNHAR
ncbi:retron system putative HNH endonuclease [Providencia rettgeri]|uniref:retron system putative HNH endonuclease n=1 Tax=Providencia rettgeri TaxID=587 RepID=UPI00235E62F3|nr:retron system putative HNH endonuclease [Providencia rettgeri]